MKTRMQLRPYLLTMVATIGAMIISACASTPDGPIRDRYGLMSVDLPWKWEDATSTFRAKSEAAQSFGRLRRDTGIQHLLFLKRDHYGDCKFRELTYTPGEAGYAWSLEKLNHEIALVRNQAMKYSVADFLLLGVATPLLDTRANSTELRLSGSTTFTRFQGWQHRYRHEFNGYRGSKVFADTWTFSMRFASKGESVKRYLVAECSLDGADKKYKEVAAAVEQLLASVDFDGDAGLAPPPAPRSETPIDSTISR